MVWRSLLAVWVASVLLQGGTAIAVPPCSAPGTALVGVSGSRTIAVAPDGQDLQVPVVDSPEWRRWIGRQLARAGSLPRWSVERSATERSVTIRIRDNLRVNDVLEASFNIRIELAASTVAPDGRYALYLQGNNVASELTILDSRHGSIRMVRLPHNAGLAPYAIGFAFSPSQECVAVSLERADGPGPETWLIDLATGQASKTDIGNMFVDRWVLASG